MGSEHGEADEQTVHDVAVPTFQMWRTEVTVAQYEACVAANKCRMTVERPGCNAGIAGREDHPINCVDWSQAVDFARFVHGRLPSEAEWEYAARSGGLVRAYPWGDAVPTCELATIDKCGASSTAPVGSHPAGNSVQGLSDLAGNVWEWVADGYHADYRGAPANGKAWEDTTEQRIVRGGAFDTGAAHARATNRASFDPASSYEFVGFRVVR